MKFPALNISLIGAPGSGKGSYGKLLSDSLSIKLLSASTILRQAKLNTTSGKLLNDKTVSKILMQNLPQASFFLDGFPRTIEQVKLMERDWPSSLQINAAVSLEVPRQVCLDKVLGRRYCAKCNKNWNIADVKCGDFIMPPVLPNECEKCDYARVGDLEWSVRDDDEPNIIEMRLDEFYTTATPVLEHYEKKGRLLRFMPYKGFEELPRFKSTLMTWAKQLKQ
mmetsp:Transcript_18439/g.27856  ORF Transcript_18439/g.27856 Transcript_18439/m.27856 type:complete len:223 (-) Transcript_18439:279-947(-)